MNFKNLYYRLLCNLKLISKQELIRKSRNEYENKYLQYGDYPIITDSELKMYQKVWPNWDVKKEDLTWARIYKKEYGFSPYVIGNWHTLLLRNVYNPYDQLSSFENKGTADIIFPKIPFPKPYVRRIRNILYDKEMNIISEKEAVDILKVYDSYIIKPSFGTFQGKGVQKINLNVSDKENIILQSFNNQESDFIAQEVIIQHPSMAALNPTSLNCCRVTSIFIDGHYGCSTMMKIGKFGSNVDNWHSSYLCGVNKDGRLFDKAYDNKLQSVIKTDNGVVFGGIMLPYYNEMISMVENFHKKYFANCGIIGWDILIDIDNKPRIIEINLTTPGIVGEQLASGDFLKDFRDQIIKHVTYRKNA